MGMNYSSEEGENWEEYPRCKYCRSFHKLKHNFRMGEGFRESYCCDVLLHLPDKPTDCQPWIQEVGEYDICEMFEGKQYDN